MARLGDVSRARFEMGGEDACHPGVFRPARSGDLLRAIRPTCPAVSRHLYFAVIRAYPYDAGLRGRFRNRRDRAMLNGRSGRADFCRIVRRQVWADLPPRVAAIRRTEQYLRSCEESLRIVRREAQRRDPIEAKERLPLRARRRDDLALARLLVEAGMASELLGIVNPAVIGRVNLIVHPVAGADRRPVLQTDAARPAVARPLPRFVILQAGVDVV